MIIFMEIEKLIRNIIVEDELAGDVIRVLNLFNGVLWMKEIESEILTMYSLVGGQGDLDRLKDIIHKLSDDGIVSIEEMIRASFTVSEKDYLVKLIDRFATHKVLMEDNRFREYIKARKDLYNQLL
jgi:hypothetical protein